jgi:N-acetylglucosaminyldiphosphoundecaprenol N-acetyl-beta-D-mannosaminyltransferase
MRTPLPERVAGSSLVWSLAAGAAEEGRSLFLLGGEAGVAERAEGVLNARFPLLNIVGTHYPPFGFENDPGELDTIVTKLRQTRPDIVYIGLGFPKQERLAVRLLDVLPQTWFLGIGISLSFISGDQKRAPRWMQVAGVEWLHRLANEPGRLSRRYLLEGIPFTAGLLLRAWMRGRR